jgi:hypothetical protein
MRSVAAIAPTEFDARLLGTWKSDRRKTFKTFRPKPGASPAAIKRLKAMFGKLIIRWGKGNYFTELDGHRDSFKYEVVAREMDSVVIRVQDSLLCQPQIRLITFEGDYYYISLGAHMSEYFRRVR